MKAAMSQNAAEVTAEINDCPVFGRGNSNADWKSLEYGFGNLENGIQDLKKPLIVTSVGGSEDSITLAAGFNVIPAFELASLLLGRGIEPDVLITSAAEYAAFCNGSDREKVLTNWLRTKEVYKAIAGNFFPGLESCIDYELLDPAQRLYPAEIEEAISQTALSDEETRARSASDNDEGYIEYMASHIQAFRDFQPGEGRKFVIKVGAQSEKPFSRFQKSSIERCIPAVLELGTVPNLVDADEGEYGQITLLYPRIGSRPPYYLETDEDPPVSDTDASLYADLLTGLSGELLARYKNLLKALGKTSIDPDEYLSVVKEAV